ncbi:YggS family pyridoxal phosphate-dependent enzyme [Rarobacter incanus]|uniref:Pyridoxal phosphate homeostasis protein n=1 Tax=Rarobacter incanus TaxID=153494 RepID=A0A542SRN1_9MICO|nr:YggS family pyridoxal phosphate-dependent enzyme [Rarobacter incanus]TQK77262.1 hypothetical protein FB389_1981 [Rarobacter incanus]
MQSINDRVAALTDRIAEACVRAGRAPGSVRVLLATKTQPPALIDSAVTAARAGGLDVLVGENRVQELVAKTATFAALDVETHLIGPLQSNKINAALRALAQLRGPTVESVASVDQAKALAQRWQSETDLAVFVQVNTSAEAAKSGIAVHDAQRTVAQIAQVPGVEVRGLMTIGARSDDLSLTARAFDSLCDLRDSVRAQVPTCTQLSMGMTRDLDIAIACGATIVRPGIGAFGPRDLHA